jgi:lipopolysaccharide export system permease protein
VPRFAQRLHYVEQVQIEKEKDDQVASGSKWLRQGPLIVNFQDYDPITVTLTSVRLISVLPNFRAERTIEADAAVFRPDSGTWTLLKTRTLVFKRNGTLDTVKATGDMSLELPVDPKKLKKDRRKPNEMTFHELRDIIGRGEQSGIDILPYKVDYQAKIAYPFAAVVVRLIVLMCGYRSERATETVMGILFAFGIGFGYYFVLSAARSLGLRGDIHPFIAAWLANVVTLAAIAIITWRSRTT